MAMAKTMSKGEARSHDETVRISCAYAVADKVRNRHLDQSGVVDTVAVNAAGVWYYVTTQSGMSIGWWHETDIAGAPSTLPPSEHRGE